MHLSYVRSSKCLIMFKYYILFWFLIIISCEKKQTLPDCDFVNALIEKDQSLRIKHFKELSPNLYYLDSLTNNQIGVDESIAYENGITDIRLIADSLAALVKVEQSFIDSIWVLQKQIDDSNTDVLINVFQNFDENTFNMLEYECARESLTIFLHSSESYKNEILNIIDKINLKEIDNSQYNHLIWHLNGRSRK